MGRSRVLWIVTWWICIHVVGTQRTRVEPHVSGDSDSWQRLEEALHLFDQEGVTDRWGRGGEHADGAAWKGWQSPLAGSPLEPLFARSLSNAGDPRRLDALATKLLEGRAITIDARGGSVTAQGMEDHSSAAFQHKGWLRLLMDWLNTAFPVTSGGGNHTLVNDAESGTSALSQELCSMYVSAAEGLDLVVIEMSINMDPSKAAAEGLVRAAALHPGSPAVVLVHWFNEPRSAFNPPARPRLTFDTCNAEASFQSVQGYYGIPAISFKAALWPLLQANRTRSPQYDHDSGVNFVFCDGRHPTPAGHRLLAAFLIHRLWDHVRRFDRRRRPRPLQHDLLPPPLYRDQGADWTVVAEPTARRCYRGEELRALPVNVTGWEWVVEHSRTGVARAGWVTREPGAVLEFALPLWVERAYLGYLETYQDIGTARVLASGGHAADAAVCAFNPWNRRSIHQLVQVPLLPDETNRPRLGVVDANSGVRGQDRGLRTTLRVTNLGRAVEGSELDFYCAPPAGGIPTPGGGCPRFRWKEGTSDKFKVNALIVVEARFRRT